MILICSAAVSSKCIFCEKLELKSCGKTEQCIKFPVFKDKDGALKEPTGKQIEPRALELGNSHLHRKVQGEDLFAREAQFHPSCRSLFNLRYLNHLRDTARATKDVKKPKQIRRHLHIWRHSLPCLILFKIPLLSREKFCCFLLYVFSTSKSWRKMCPYEVT